MVNDNWYFTNRLHDCIMKNKQKTAAIMGNTIIGTLFLILFLSLPIIDQSNYWFT